VSFQLRVGAPEKRKIKALHRMGKNRKLGFKLSPLAGQVKISGYRFMVLFSDCGFDTMP
jgi:hypothetical protein